MTPMQKLIRDRLAELGDLSIRAAARQSSGLISYATISKIVNGQSLGPWGPKALKGLALALDVPLSEVEKAAEASRGHGGTPFLLTLPESARLNASERRAVENVVKSLLNARKD